MYLTAMPDRISAQSFPAEDRKPRPKGKKTTHKSSYAGRMETLRRKQIRSEKYRPAEGL